MDFHRPAVDNAPMTLWTIQLGPGQAQEGLKWVRRLLAGYNLSLLASIKIHKGRSKKAIGVYGKCEYPTQARPSYRITCTIPGPFPCAIHIRKPPQYMDEQGQFDPLPPRCRRGVQCIDRRTGRRWYRVIGQTQLNDLDEGVVWIMAHEAFHYLRRTRQIAGRNNEIQADAWADQMLQRFRDERQTRSSGKTNDAVKPVSKPGLRTATTGVKTVNQQSKPQPEARPGFLSGWMSLWQRPPGKTRKG